MGQGRTMSLESPDNEKNFPDEDGERGGAGKKRDTSRKRDGKRDKKEKGYTMFEQEESEEELVLPEDVKSPTKAKKTKPGFKFPAKKDIFPRMKEKEEKKDKDSKKEEKEKKKEEKEGKKHKIKEKKKSKHTHIDIKTTAPKADTCENPIFGIPLAMAVERNKSHDGIELPAIVRECIDYVEECGLTCEGIYRISGVKSKVQHLKDCYNKGVPVDLVEHEPNIVASLLKQFLRELPEPVLTTSLMPKFEEASTIKSERKKVETLIRLIEELPACNRLLLSWMIVHMTHIIELQKENKMSLQNVSIVLSPTMQISHRVLNVLFTYAHQIFKDTYLKKYVPPLKPATSRWSLELPDNTGALEEELAKQESLLNQLHGRLNAGLGDSQMEEQLWEVQRVVTQLKRKIKFAKKAQGTAERRRKDLEVKRSSQLSETEELHLELRTAPAPHPPATVTTTTTTTAVVEMQPKVTKKQKQEGQGEDITSKDKQEESEQKQEKAVADSKKGTTESAKKTPAPAEKQTSDEGKGDAGKSHEPQELNKTETPKAEDSTADAEQQPQEAAPEKPKEISTEEKPESQELKESKDKIVQEEEVAATAEDQAATVQTSESKEGETEETVKEDESEVKDSTEQAEVPSEKPSEEKPSEKIAEKTDVAVTEETVQVEGDSGKNAVGVNEAGTDKMDAVGHQGDGEAGRIKDEVTTSTGKPKEMKVVPPPAPPAEVKPRGPVQVHPHLYLLLEPLQPIKAQPLKPRRERAEKPEESQRRSVKLRELEEELLGEGKKEEEITVGDKDQPDGEKVQFAEDEEYEYDAADDEELQRLVEEEFSLRLEEEELLAIGDELRKKIETEESEIERLQQEIQELQYLRHDSDMEDMSSGSDSSYESEDEDDLAEMLSTLKQENHQLEQENADLCQKIHEERMICLSVKLQIRLLQQKQLESSQSSMLGD
nr:hypothetical protein BaRGS_000066 [Batillaria attramentaria]